MKPSIVLAADLAAIDDRRIDEVRSLLPGWDILVHPDEQTVQAALDRIEIAFGGPLRLLSGAPGLKWMQLGGAGADRLFADPPHRRFLLTNASGVHAVPISEHLMAMLLALARALPRAIRAQARRSWESRKTPQVFELAGRRVLLIGLGAIGTRFARLASALDMDVVGVRRSPDLAGEHVLKVVSPDRLAEELPLADFVVITTPLTTETAGLIGRAEIRLMKRTAYLLNIGRGRIVDEEALVGALLEGRLAGAGLDVFSTEPLPADSPLWDMDNVIVTSHYAGLTPEYAGRLWGIFSDNLRRYVAGKPLHNLVDWDLEY